MFLAFRSLLEGLIADRYGRKPVLLFTAMLMVVGGTIFALSENILILLVTAVVFSVSGTLPYTPAEQAMLTEKVADQERTTAFSVNAFLGTATGMLGSFAAGLPELLQSAGIEEVVSYKPIFIAFAMAGAISLGLFAIIEETVKGRETTGNDEGSDGGDRDERLLLMKWSGVVSIDLIGGSFTSNFLSYWFYLRFGAGPGKIGTLFGLSQLLSASSYLLGLKMANKVGTIRATVLSRLPVVVVNASTPLMPTYNVAAMLRIFMSMFSMIDIPLRQSYLMGVIGSRRRASAAGVVTVVSRFTSAAAPSVTGYLFEYVSMSLPFYISASFQLASASMMYLMFKDIRPPEEETDG